MRAWLVAAALLPSLARAGTPITVDKEYSQQTVQALIYELAALEQQTGGNVRAQLAIMRDQLTNLKRHFDMASGMVAAPAGSPSPVAGNVAPPPRLAPPPAPRGPSHAETIARLRTPDSTRPRMPPRPPKRVRLESGTFLAIVKVMRAEEYNEEKLAILEEASQGWYFDVAQLSQLCAMLNVAEDKLQAIGLVAPFVVDKHNAEALYALFSSDEDKKKVHDLLLK
jgi:hypothetical protein